jgi:segregation and condensation protein B
LERPPLSPVLEALLFVADEPLTVGQLARLAETKQAEVEEALITLSKDCRERGIRLQRHLDAVQLVSAPEMAIYIERLLGSGVERRLSGAALEVLAIVAYRQPITRAAIEAIRGVNSDRALRTLQTLGMIAETGRLETVGRPLLFGTTFEFLQHFGLGSLDDLPPVEEMTHASGATLAQQLPLPGEPGGRPATDGQPARRRATADQGQTGETTQE